MTRAHSFLSVEALFINHPGFFPWKPASYTYVARRSQPLTPFVHRFQVVAAHSPERVTILSSVFGQSRSNDARERRISIALGVSGPVRGGPPHATRAAAVPISNRLIPPPPQPPPPAHA